MGLFLFTSCETTAPCECENGTNGFIEGTEQSINIGSESTVDVFKKIDSTFEKIQQQNKHNCFVVDAALIYESGADTHMDYIIVITSLLRYRTERVMSRNNMTRDDFLKRVSLQWPDEDKEHMADYIIQNNSDLNNLERESKKIFDSII